MTASWAEAFAMNTLEGTKRARERGRARLSPAESNNYY